MGKLNAVLVGLITQTQDERKTMEYLDELEFLAETAGAIGVKKFIQKVDRPDSRTYIRSGKLQEIREYCEENDIPLQVIMKPDCGHHPHSLEDVAPIIEFIEK